MTLLNIINKKFKTAVFLLVLFIIPNSLALNYTCSFLSTSAAFGNFNPLNYTSQNLVINVTLQCTSNLAVSISTGAIVISFSQGKAGSFTRYMTASSNKLSYNLYKDSGYTQILGDGSGSTNTFSSTGNAISVTPTNLNYTVYGKIPSQPSAALGNYTDSIIITATYN